MDQPEQWAPHQDLPSMVALTSAVASLIPVPSENANLAGAKEAIDLDKFQLQRSQMEYDMKVFETWQRKCSNAKAARFHAQKSWKLAQRKKAQSGAKQYCKTMCSLAVWDRKVETAINHVMTFRRQVQSRAGIVEDLPLVVLANMTSLSEIPAPLFIQIEGFLSWCLSESPQSCAVVLYPVHTYHRGKLHMDELRVTQTLVKAAGNLDSSFSVLFANQVDHRDQRPMVYTGRLVLPTNIEPTKSVWWSSDLRRLQRTEEA